MFKQNLGRYLIWVHSLEKAGPRRINPSHDTKPCDFFRELKVLIQCVHIFLFPAFDLGVSHISFLLKSFGVYLVHCKSTSSVNLFKFSIREGRYNTVFAL